MQPSMRGVTVAIVALAVSVVVLAGAILAAGLDSAPNASPATCSVGGSNGIPLIVVEGTCPPDMEQRIRDTLKNIGNSI